MFGPACLTREPTWGVKVWVIARLEITESLRRLGQLSEEVDFGLKVGHRGVRSIFSLLDLDASLTLPPILNLFLSYAHDPPSSATPNSTP